MTKPKPHRDYPVGYATPPKHTQFKKGASGNSMGAKKRTLEDPIAKALSRPVYLTENGKRKQVTALVALAMKTVEEGLKGGELPAVTRCG